MKINYTKKLAEYQKKASKVFKSNGKIKTKFYHKELDLLHLELVKLQRWVIENDKRLLIIFEGMDTGGKSSSIKALSSFWNPREARSVALAKPNDKERG
jgi:polyphosphate kinase 2 (PPK2 family)